MNHHATCPSSRVKRKLQFTRKLRTAHPYRNLFTKNGSESMLTDTARSLFIDYSTYLVKGVMHYSLDLV